MKRQKKENFSVRIRHSCAIEDFCAYNDNLTPDQRQLIKRTPFGVLLDIPKTNINGKLLECLIDKWDEGESGFWLKDKLVRFTQHDVACILGLRVGGTRVTVFEDYGSSQLDTILRSFFPNQTLTRRFISQLISPCASNDDFVRMYIALAFTFFLFPLPSRGIHRHFFRLLDNLDDLSEYGWGEAVYVFLVDGIRDAVRARKMKTNYSEIRIRGCALLLQVWALEHTSMVEATSSSCSWPRIRKWTSKNLSSRHVHSIIQFTESDKEAVPILAPTEEELKESVIQESLHMIDCYFPSTQPPSVHGHVDAHNLVISAFGHSGDVVSFDDEASLMGGSLHLTDVLYPSSSPRTESSNGSKLLPSHKIGGFDYPQPTTSSPDIISSIYSIGVVSALDDFVDNMGLWYDQPLTFPGQVTNTMICDTESTTQAFCDDDHLWFFKSDCAFQSQNPGLESQADLQATVSGFLLTRSAAAGAQSRWTKISSVLRWFSMRRIVALKKTYVREIQIFN